VRTVKTLEGEARAFTCEICILAGGLSRRMGRDKSRLRLGQKTMISRVQETARTTGWPVRVIRRDLRPRCGPLGGIYTALLTTHRDSVLFLACDMPFVGREVLGRLLGQFHFTPHALFVSYRGRVGFPFLLAKGTVGVVAKQIDKGDFSLQALAKAINAKLLRLPRALAGQIRNVNTPLEWERARRLWDRRTSRLVGE